MPGASASFPLDLTKQAVDKAVRAATKHLGGNPAPKVKTKKKGAKGEGKAASNGKKAAAAKIRLQAMRAGKSIRHNKD